jgi:GNAT superfamily N-acetyltransferase
MSDRDPVDVGETTEYIVDGSLTVRRATMAHYPAVASFTADTWGEGSDYVPRAYPGWMADEGEAQRTFVVVDTAAEPPDPASVDATEKETLERIEEVPEGQAVGLCQAVALSDHEGWLQAMRVHPGYRGRGLSVALNDAAFHWLAEAGRSVARNMVFSWNAAGLAGSRASGFGPGAEFRWVEPTPDTEATPACAAPGIEDAPATQQADAAWGFWQGSDAREQLRGLSLDDGERWALSELTRSELRTAAAAGRLQVVSSDVPVRGDGSGGNGVRGFAYRARLDDRETDEGEQETWAEYGVAAWADHDACDRLLAAVARDAAAAGADKTRVLIPEAVRWVSDAAAAGVGVDDDPEFVMHADLTRRQWRR